jgi:hypothetical protein
MPMPTFPLVRLGAFRAELHACYTRRADALVELGDALLCAQAVPSLPHLSLEPVHQRGWGSVYAALARGQVDAERLRDLLVSVLLDADPPVFAVDVTTWPRCDAECSPSRGFYSHPRATRPASRSSPAGPSSGSPSWALTATPGPPRWMPAGCTPWRTPTRPPLNRSACCLSGCLPVDRCRGLCSMAAATPPSSPWTSPRRPPRCWCGCGRTAAFTPTRHQRCAPQGWPAAPPRRQVQLRRPGHLAHPTATLGCQDDQYGAVTVAAWSRLPPKQQRHPGHGSRGPRPIVRGTVIRVQVERVPAKPRPPKVLRLSPVRVRRGFPRLLVRLGSPAAAPKPSGCPPGRPKVAARVPRGATRRSRSPRTSRPRPRRPPDRPGPLVTPSTSVDG